MSKVLVIDNFDSFTYNLVHYLETFHEGELEVVRNNELDKVVWEGVGGVVISPGPGLPKEAGQLMQYLPTILKKKTLGVCLGMQAILQFFNHQLFNLKTVIHGQSTEISITNAGSGIFKDLPLKIKVGRYHSWVAKPIELPSELKSTAFSNDNHLMAIQHQTLPIEAVQFHPESVLTEYGKKMIENWLKPLAV